MSMSIYHVVPNSRFYLLVLPVVSSFTPAAPPICIGIRRGIGIGINRNIDIGGSRSTRPPPCSSSPSSLSRLFGTNDDDDDDEEQIQGDDAAVSRTNDIDNINQNQNNISDAQPLLLSQKDLKRFTQIKSRQKKIPTMMMKKIVLPGESISLGSNDIKFNIMMDAVEMEGLTLLGSTVTSQMTQEGQHGTCNTMVFGVTTKIQELSSANDGYTSIQLKADQVFQVIDSPFLDETESFYYCNIDILLPIDDVDEINNGNYEIDDDSDDSDNNQQQQDDGTAARRLQEATKMYNQIPDLVELLIQRIGAKKGGVSLKQMTALVESFGEIPESSFSDRAFWAAALIHRMHVAAAAVGGTTNDYYDAAASDLKQRILSSKSVHERLRLSWAALHGAIDNVAAKS